ncbi:hypothetical protein [Chelatococcus reniformis]|uniref:Uncharacterized protein n=1 Tax=Chelatococcus reniformis TaxID=1494448 RepID=A0A916XKB5_9HYPH|nr:hypothetical protein [Chelatococcus reniformis]GGC80970.1 hypothetical protein GCM10010994_43730 [Chelatococcus reniformis]
MRFILRLIGFLCVAAGFSSLVIDGARAIANTAWAPTPLAEVAHATFPAWYAGLGPAVSAIHPWLWSPLLTGIFAAPAFAVAMIAGFLLMLLGRTPRETVGFYAN